MDQLTARQHRILQYIRRTVDERGYPPTVREIGEAVGLTSSSSVHSQLANLERKGLLHKDPTKPRAIGLAAGDPDQRDPGVRVPLLGAIAAGTPIMAAENVEAYLPVPTEFAGPEDHFALRVKGDSMIGAGIGDGDVVVVRRQDDAQSGDIVAAVLPGPGEDEATVKRLKRRGSRIVLVPENPAMEPSDLTDGLIVGKVVAVLRRVK
jgi:repressor LexA